jgi:PadR family transcriptional regulator PadR
VSGSKRGSSKVADGTKLSYSAALILQVLAGGYQYGFDIMDVTGLPSGTVYPALRRLERAGLVNSKWEREETARLQLRPARKYYQVTRTGQEVLANAVKRYHTLEHALDGISGKMKHA